MTVNGKEYVMIRHNLIAQECPILGINHRDTFRKRMLKLVDAGLLNRCDSNQEVGNSLYSRGEKFSVFVFSDQKLGTLPTKIGTPADDERHKHNTIEHNITPNTLFPLEENKDIIPTETTDDGFENAWALYGRKGSKIMAHNYWKKLSKADREAIIQTIPLYLAAKPDEKFRKDFSGWINPSYRRWEDKIVGETNTPSKSHVFVA